MLRNRNRDALFLSNLCLCMDAEAVFDTAVTVVRFVLLILRTIIFDLFCCLKGHLIL